MTVFATLWRSFFAQFFSSETVTSDMRLRQGVIWVMAFLVAPGLAIALRFGTHYQFALHFAPERADGTLLMVMILFVSYSAVAIGLIAVFVWDALSFGQRDAMALGVLPNRGLDRRHGEAGRARGADRRSGLDPVFSRLPRPDHGGRRRG